MKRRFDAAEKILVGETALARPALRPSAETLRRHFETEIGQSRTELPNPHLEPRVPADQRHGAIRASVLIAVVLRDEGPTTLVTKRPPGISYPGHWVFPGGRADENDSTPIETALREAEEEVGLDRERIEVLGSLGDYYSHSGFRIVPTLALLHPPFEWTPAPGEVEEVAEIPLSHLLDSSSYFIFRFQDRQDRAHFALDFGARCGDSADRMLTGVTASLCIGLYSELEKTHGST